MLAPETMNETLASDSEDEGGEDAGNEHLRIFTLDEMKSLGDDSLPIDVTRDEQQHRDSGCTCLWLSKFAISPLQILNINIMQAFYDDLIRYSPRG